MGHCVIKFYLEGKGTRMQCYQCHSQIQETCIFCPRCGTQTNVNETVIQSALNQNQQAIAAIYHIARTPMYNEIHLLVASPEDCEELYQDALEKVLAHLDQLKDPAKFRAWAKVIARNTAIDFLRRQGRFAGKETHDEEAIGNVADTNPDAQPVELTERSEVARQLNTLLHELPDDQRVILVMQASEQVTYREIAEQMGLNENTVRSKALYAKRKLRVRIMEMRKAGIAAFVFVPLNYLGFLIRKLDEFDVPDVPDGLDRFLKHLTSAVSGISPDFMKGQGNQGSAHDGGSGAAHPGQTEGNGGQASPHPNSRGTAEETSQAPSSGRAADAGMKQNRAVLSQQQRDPNSAKAGGAGSGHPGQMEGNGRQALSKPVSQGPAEGTGQTLSSGNAADAGVKQGRAASSGIRLPGGKNMLFRSGMVADIIHTFVWAVQTSVKVRTVVIVVLCAVVGLPITHAVLHPNAATDAYNLAGLMGKSLSELEKQFPTIQLLDNPYGDDLEFYGCYDAAGRYLQFEVVIPWLDQRVSAISMSAHDADHSLEGVQTGMTKEQYDAALTRQGYQKVDQDRYAKFEEAVTKSDHDVWYQKEDGSLLYLPSDIQDGPTHVAEVELYSKAYSTDYFAGFPEETDQSPEDPYSEEDVFSASDSQSVENSATEWDPSASKDGVFGVTVSYGEQVLTHYDIRTDVLHDEQLDQDFSAYYQDIYWTKDKGYDASIHDPGAVFVGSIRYSEKSDSSAATDPNLDMSGGILGFIQDSETGSALYVYYFPTAGATAITNENGVVVYPSLQAVSSRYQVSMGGTRQSAHEAEEG